MPKLRLIGIRDYTSRRWAAYRPDPLWQFALECVVHLTCCLPMGSSKDLDTAADFKTAWEELKARTTPEDLAAACRDMNVRDDR